MGYGYAETFLIVFLTHPGVILPTTSSATGLIPGQYAEVVPEDGFPPVMSGLWQTLWVWILSLPGERSKSVAWSMYVLYLIFLGLYAYFFLSMRLQQGV